MARILLATLCLTVAIAQAESHYTQQMFRRGLYEDGVLVTTAPLFVLITLRDARTGSEREAAIPGPFLLGAIDAEYHFGTRRTAHQDIYKALAEQQQKELRIALAQPNRVFVFRNPKARNNVEPRYTLQVLQEVRTALAAKSRKEMLAAARANKSWLHLIYESKNDPLRYFAYRDAVAHALLEQGIAMSADLLRDSLTSHICNTHHNFKAIQ